MGVWSSVESLTHWWVALLVAACVALWWNVKSLGGMSGCLLREECCYLLQRLVALGSVQLLGVFGIFGSVWFLSSVSDFLGIW